MEISTILHNAHRVVLDRIPSVSCVFQRCICNYVFPKDDRYTYSCTPPEPHHTHFIFQDGNSDIADFRFKCENQKYLRIPQIKFIFC